MERVIGIDLGTSNSAAAYFDGENSKIIPAAEGSSRYGKSFASYVAFTEEGDLLVGDPAKAQAITNPSRTITKIKRKMGTKETVEIDGKEYLPQQISAYILRKIKKDAEEFIGEPINKAVITVPAYFDDNQRTATKEAGEIAGLDVVRIINEPTAAAIAYGVDKVNDTSNTNIMVFDFGGGTLDVTIMEFGNGEFNVKSSSGDTNLGGTDMDEIILKFLASEFEKEHGINLLEEEHARQRLEEATEDVKIKLSNVATSEVNLPFIAIDENNKPLNFIYTLTRSKLEELVEDIVEKSAEPMQQALDDAKMSKSDIDKVILVGGPTRMPMVQRFVEDFIGKGYERGLDPMECVAIGASTLGSVIDGSNAASGIKFSDVTPLSLGTVLYNGLTAVLIDRNTPIPTRATKVFSTIEDNQKTVLIEVVQGERPMAADNTSLGKFELSGIQPAPAGVPQIEVTFDIDESGILNVSAIEQQTGKKQSITISSSNKLSNQEINEIISEAEMEFEKDDIKRELAELRNSSDAAIKKGNDCLEKLGKNLSRDMREDIKNSISELKAAVVKKDVDEIKEKIAILNEKVDGILSNVYMG